MAEPEAPVTPEKSPPPKKPGEGYSAPKPKVTYKPYTLKDYGAMKRSFGYRAGGLGPDTENSAYKSKVSSHVTSYLTPGDVTITFTLGQAPTVFVS